MGRTVFCLHPHQDFFNVAAIALVPVPDDVPARRATLAANMETALNALWDAGAGPGDRIVVVGAGVVGLLVTALAARLPGAEVTAVDTDAGRAALVASLGARFARAEQAPGEADIVFHASATSAGLATAIECAGFEGTVVEMSWYGDKPVDVDLGERVPQPPPQARLLAGRPGRGEPPPALGLPSPHRACHALAGACRRSTSWSPRRSPSRTPPASCRACLAPMRRASRPSSATPRLGHELVVPRQTRPLAQSHRSGCEPALLA